MGLYNNDDIHAFQIDKIITISIILKDIPEYTLTYTFDEENSQKFSDALQKEYSGTLQDMVTAAFGEDFHFATFDKFCEENGIEYKYSQEMII